MDQTYYSYDAKIQSNNRRDKKKLEKELADEKLKTKVLNMMIDISDKHYATQIRKKFILIQATKGRKIEFKNTGSKA